MNRGLSSMLFAASIASVASAYIKEACNGQVKVFTASSGYFNTPNYGFGSYAPNDRCFWQILINPGQRIKLEFKAFATPKSRDCSTGDRVSVYDSDQENPENLIGSYCGTTIPKPIVSRSNKLFVKFVSDRQHEGPGFYVLYSALNDRPQTIPPSNAGFRRGVTPSGHNDVAAPMERVGPKCNGKVSVLTAPSGIIQSPNYGIGSYFPDDTCYWQVIAIPGKIIRIQLISMGLEEGTGCHKDYTTIYDGATESAPLLQAYCGRKRVPSELLSTGSALFVKFRSDEENQRDGFRFMYSLVDKPSSPTPPPKPPTTPVPKDKCSGRHQIFTSKSGYVSSPNFGYGEYYANDVCFWQILAPENNKVKLSFQTFEVEDGFACPKDELVVYDGPSEMSPLIGSFCGSNKPATIVSSSNGLYVKFSTDAHAQYIGFKIFYEFVEPPKKERCNGEMNTLTDTSGFIFSPNYGKGDYPEDDICHWQIIGQENTRVRLKVESLVLEQSPDCTKDYLSVWDGPGENDQKMKVFCGSVAQEVLLSSMSFMYLKFKANGDGNYPGFKLFYEVVEAPPKDKCNGKTEVLHNFQGYFQSPNLGNGLYYNNDLCFWDLRASPGQHVRLIFEKFDLEESNDCQFHDHLAIYDGQSEDSAQLADLCGYDLPKTLESSDNYMFIKFQSDAARRAAGFRIFYEFFKPAKTEPILPPPPEPCNGKEFLLTGAFGSFNSPNFGSGEYFADDDCYWLVTSDYFNRIKLSFDSFDIEADPQCLRDRVIVYDGPTEQAPVLGTFCGYSLPNPIESSTAQLLVKFESDSSAQRTGFKASYDTEPLTPALRDPRLMMYPNSPWGLPAVNPPAKSLPGLKPVPVDQSVSVVGGTEPANMGRPAKCNGAVTLVKATAFPMYAQSPNFGGDNYYPQDTCYWLIQSDTGTVIKINFLSFELENGGRTCPNDYVSLYDGEGDQAPLLGKFCGSNLPRTVQSNGRSLLVEFNSDQSNEKGGFKFAYEAVSTPSTGQVASNMSMSEVNWPQLPNFGEIAVASGMNLPPTPPPGVGFFELPTNPEIVVSEVSNPQYSVRDTNQQYSVPLTGAYPQSPEEEYSQSYDGPTSVPVLVGENNMVPVFRKAGDNSIFNFDETEVLESPITGNNEIYALPPQNSGSTFMSIPVGAHHEEVKHPEVEGKPRKNKCRGRVIRLRSPDDGSLRRVSTWHDVNGNYETGDNCNWFLAAGKGKVIQLKFRSYGLRGSKSDACESDYIAIYDGFNRKAPLIGRFCAKYPPPQTLFTQSAYAFLEFKADSNANDRGIGFAVDFKQIDQSALSNRISQHQVNSSVLNGRCLGREIELTHHEGIIRSPVDVATNEYFPLDTCKWQVRVPNGKRIAFEFKNLEIEPTPDCQYDAVRIFDGIQGRGGLLVGSFCGSVTPEGSRVTSSNVADVVFDSDSTVQGKGFELMYRVV